MYYHSIYGSTTTVLIVSCIVLYCSRTTEKPRKKKGMFRDPLGETPMILLSLPKKKKILESRIADNA